MDGLLFFNHVFFNEFETQSEDEEEEHMHLDQLRELFPSQQQLISNDFQDSFVLNGTHMQIENSDKLLNYSSMTQNQMYTLQNNKTLQRSKWIEEILKKEQLSKMEWIYLQYKAEEYLNEKILEIQIIKNLALSIHKTFKKLSYKQMMNVIMLRMALLEQC